VQKDIIVKKNEKRRKGGGVVLFCCRFIRAMIVEPILENIPQRFDNIVQKNSEHRMESPFHDADFHRVMIPSVIVGDHFDMTRS